CSSDLDISSGSYEKTNTWLETVNYKAGWRKYLAAAVKKEVSIPVIAANLIRSAEQAVQQIEEGTQDLIGLGRPLLADPELPLKIKEGREEDVQRCIVCCQCYESLLKNAWVGEPLRCSVNPTLSQIASKPADSEGTVVVVGAGAAGLQASLSLKERGFQVILFEKAPRPGGQILLADKAPEKEKLGWCIDDLIHAVQKAGVDLRLNTEADARTILDESPDAVILSTGAVPLKPSIPGVSRETVYTFDEILSGSRFPGKGESVIVVGSGLTGLETAEYLLARGCQVRVVEMADQPAPGAHFQHRDEALETLVSQGAGILTSVKLIEIREGSIILDHTGIQEEIASDAVVLALGSRPLNTLEKDLKDFAGVLKVIGDASEIGRIADAVEQGYRTAVELNVERAV
ncbi:MAG: FAD-dependent oxidoreductase, partial [Spirochaetales bacterium]|nr:FAD-dependent oxidoreductase [Spirochaetales bacterium]